MGVRMIKDFGKGEIILIGNLKPERIVFIPGTIRDTYYNLAEP